MEPSNFSPDNLSQYIPSSMPSLDSNLTNMPLPFEEVHHYFSQNGKMPLVTVREQYRHIPGRVHEIFGIDSARVGVISLYTPKNIDTVLASSRGGEKYPHAAEREAVRTLNEKLLRAWK